MSNEYLQRKNKLLSIGLALHSTTGKEEINHPELSAVGRDDPHNAECLFPSWHSVVYQ